MLVHGKNQLFVHLAHQGHLHNVHGFVGGNALAIFELNINAEFVHVLVDSSTATMNDNGIDAHDLQHNDVAHHGIAQLRVDHGSAAIFDKDGFACSVLDPRERFNKNLSGMRRSYLSVSCVFHER